MALFRCRFGIYTRYKRGAGDSNTRDRRHRGGPSVPPRFERVDGTADLPFAVRLQILLAELPDSGDTPDGAGVPALHDGEWKIRANFVAKLILGGFGSGVTLNLTPWLTLAADAGALVNRFDVVAMGGTLSTAPRNAMLTAIGLAPAAREQEHEDTT